MNYLRNIKAIVTLCFGVTILLSCAKQPSEWSVESPSGNIRYNVTLVEKGQLFYQVIRTDSGKETVIIRDSPLGITLNKVDYNKNLAFDKTNAAVIRESFELPAGKQRGIENKANELSVTFRNPEGSRLQIIIRAYDDGVAFRYCIPDTSNQKYTFDDEMTGFAIAGEGKAWIQPYDKVSAWAPAYETYYENGVLIGTPAPSSEGWAFPALFKTSSGWLLLTEAATDSNYFGAHLQQNAPEGLYSIRMPEEAEANNSMAQRPSLTLPWSSPWRVIILGKELSTLVESNMVVKLNPPSKPEDFTWVKPGRASWSWWSEPSSPRDFNALKKYVDLSAEMGWEYSLVDANWDLMKGGNIEQLIRYAHSKDIGILLWYNSGGPHNEVTERPRDIMNHPQKRKEEFKKLASWGVKGVKVDFFQSDKPQMIKLYHDILKDAAENKIMAVFHGCTIPRGWNRTWPNLLSMEAVRGAENYGFDTLYPEKTIWHNTILPFTRNIPGSMDYTPVTFSDQKFPHQTSNAHELALSIVFESGILHLADRAESYKNLPEEVISFLKNVPVVWDETLLLQGEPGKLCIMARRNGNTWYLGGINGTSGAQSWNIDLSRLGKKDFMAEIITDGVESRQFTTKTMNLTSNEDLKINVLPCGGFVAILK